ncbi:MAG: hypothetical protein ACJA01_000612 [Saprospiraceae bacterium]|jgi:hypothetical protein
MSSPIMNDEIICKARGDETKLFCTKRSKLSYLFFALISLLILSCSEDIAPPSLPDLNTYVQRFEQEARLKGYDFDLSVVEAVYVDEIMVEDEKFCGYTNYNGRGIRRIEISTSGSCNWANLSDIQRENFFFHEIGHAFLNRTHDESLLCDGSPLSIMTTTANNWNIYSENEGDKRDYYISELIDKLAALDQCINYQHEWISDSVFYKYIYEDDSWIFDSRNGNYSGARNAANDMNVDAIGIELIPGKTKDLEGRRFRRINNLNIPEFADVTLKVTMNSEMLTGTGAAISIRIFHSPVGKEGAESVENLYLTTTEAPVSGELNNYVEELTIPC